MGNMYMVGPRHLRTFWSWNSIMFWLSVAEGHYYVECLAVFPRPESLGHCISIFLFKSWTIISCPFHTVAESGMTE